MALDPQRYALTGGQLQELVGPDIASAATIAPTYGIHRVSGVAAIVNITIPFADFAGTILLLPTGIFTWTAAGNIVVLGTAVVGKTLFMTYYPITSKWYPSYVA